MSSEDGWPDVPGDTALSIRIPEADAFVRAPFPAHITVLYPFLPAARITPDVHAELSALFADRDPFDLTFAEFRRYPGVLYLPPDPDGPVRALTASLRKRWPEAVPYRGVFGPTDLDPHLTLANDEGPQTYEAAYDALERELRPMLPVTARVDAVRLIVTNGRVWQDRAEYGLGRVRQDQAEYGLGRERQDQAEYELGHVRQDQAEYELGRERQDRAEYGLGRERQDRAEYGLGRERQDQAEYGLGREWQVQVDGGPGLVPDQAPRAESTAFSRRT